MPGTLYIVATPIGNLGDITLRAIETLKSCDVIASEDTRRSENLLRHFGFVKPLIRYDEHTHGPASKRIIEMLIAGKSVALVTDAGTPGISDPGTRLVAETALQNLPIVPIPGASSVVAAISASGLGSDGFVFLGFLPRKTGKAKRLLQETMGLGKTVAVLESPYRVKATLQMIAELWPQCPIVVAREITKLHEEFLRGQIEQVMLQMNSKEPKGEFVLILGPAESAPRRNENT